MRSLFALLETICGLSTSPDHSRPVETIDLYSSEVERNQCWASPELEQGVHYLHVAATGEKNENSSGTLIDLDHFIVH